MKSVHVVGIDPGLVHTGVVLMIFHPHTREVVIDDLVLAGAQSSDAARIKMFFGVTEEEHIFIEGYKPRSHFDSDSRMTQLVNDLKRELKGSTVLNNMGILKVVKQPLMEALQVWNFKTKTHHQDLRSAARIALLGMMKDDNLNRLLADFMRDMLDGKPWDVFHG